MKIPVFSLVRFFILINLVLAASGCKPTASPSLSPVTLQLNWTHQAQFAGFYAADQISYYAADGLAGIFAQGGSNIDAIAKLLTGSTRFGIRGGDVRNVDITERKQTEEVPRHQIKVGEGFAGRAFLDLAIAYDKTIEGWSMALDLRDKEMEGHTLRVIEMTQFLALKIGVSNEELVHIRRGSLLHDIGKLGVPDAILLKPGPLTEDEWGLMKKHPIYAYEMIAPIEFLKPVIEIPFCHHEGWDGSGYPRSLRGADFPISARIFAIVDGWDALTSDRIYRPAWSKENAAAYNQEQSEKQFDPLMVEKFWMFFGIFDPQEQL